MSEQRLTRVKAIHWPVGETCGSSSKAAFDGVVVTRVASPCVTPSASEDGISQIPSRAGSPQSLSIASCVPAENQLGSPWNPGPVVSCV